MNLLEAARSGDLDAILAAGEDDPAVAYKWLTVASDLGHEDADDLIDDLMEATDLRFDDDNFLTGEVHFGLGLAYLTGADGLPRDLELAATNLAEARTRHWPASVQGGADIVADARAGLPADARPVFDAAYPA